MPVYGPQFREQTVKKIMPPHNQSVAQISRDTDVAVPNLYSWKNLFRNQGFVVPAKPSLPDSWDSKAKLAAFIMSLGVLTICIRPICLAIMLGSEIFQEQLLSINATL